MLNNKNLKLISIIKTYINNDPKLHIKSYYYNRKYTIDELLPYIIEILEDGISFRKIKSSICWSTIYKFHQKLVQFKIIENSYELNVNKYDVIINYITHMCKYIFERYLLAKVYFTKFKDWRAFKLNNCICQKIPFIF